MSINSAINDALHSFLKSSIKHNYTFIELSKKECNASFIAEFIDIW